jgi:glutamate-1-semialdehyde aminotransferase
MKNKITESLQYWKRAQKIIPGGTQTLSKGPNMFTFGVYPIYLERGEGSHVWDVDGNEYIDYPLALGPITLGYNYPSTVKTVCQQIKKGSTFSLMNPLEIEVAELLVGTIPCAEMVRFAKNGADATSAAIRLSRIYTSREHVAVCGYHGWHDWYIASTEHNLGVPKAMRDLIHSFKYNDIKSLESIFAKYPNKIAAVIMEAVSVELPQPGFLEEVKRVAHKYGAVLIFDEIVTGFRLALGGAQQYYKVTPDLATFGKGMANGLPISALVGKKQIMKEATKMFFSTTYGGELLSLAASKDTIIQMKKNKVQDYFWKIGDQLKNVTQKLVIQYGLGDSIKVKGLSPKFWIDFVAADGSEHNDLKGLFFQEVITRGVLIGGLQYISYSHSQKDIDKTLNAFESACVVCQRALRQGNIRKYLKGEAPSNVFKRHHSGEKGG